MATPLPGHVTGSCEGYHGNKGVGRSRDTHKVPFKGDNCEIISHEYMAEYVSSELFLEFIRSYHVNLHSNISIIYSRRGLDCVL